MVQIAALKYITGDYDGVRKSINYFVTHQFQDQIAASGEQPFEAVRTRPFHYRCFNLEALIVRSFLLRLFLVVHGLTNYNVLFQTLAKIGDQVGINMWASQSRYRATIQDALDYVMQESPGSESIQSLLPHVASVAVAYGDPHKQYADFIATKDTGATHRTWFWHDVPGAFGPGNSFSHQRRGQDPKSSERDDEGILRRLGRIMCKKSSPTSTSSGGIKFQERADELTTANATGVIWAPGEEPVRPDVFGLTGDDVIELDDAVFVGWDDVRPYYAAVRPVDSTVNSTTAEVVDTPSGDSAGAGDDETNYSRRRKRLGTGPARIRAW